MLFAIPQFYQLDHQNTTIKMYRIVASILGTSPFGIAGYLSTYPPSGNSLAEALTCTHGLKKKYPARRHPGDPGGTPVCHPRFWRPGRAAAIVGVRPGHRAEWGSVGKAGPPIKECGGWHEMPEYSLSEKGRNADSNDGKGGGAI